MFLKILHLFILITIFPRGSFLGCRCSHQYFFVKKMSVIFLLTFAYTMVKNFPHVHLKIHDFFHFLATTITFHDFINIYFLHVLTGNHVCWRNNKFEKLPQS